MNYTGTLAAGATDSVTTFANTWYAADWDDPAGHHQTSTVYEQGALTIGYVTQNYFTTTIQNNSPYWSQYQVYVNGTAYGAPIWIPPNSPYTVNINTDNPGSVTIQRILASPDGTVQGTNFISYPTNSSYWTTNAPTNGYTGAISGDSGPTLGGGIYDTNISSGTAATERTLRGGFDTLINNEGIADRNMQANVQLLTKLVGDGFVNVNGNLTQLSSLTQRVDTSNSKLDTLNTNLNALNGGVTAVNTNLNNTANGINSLLAAFSNYDAKMGDWRTNWNTYTGSVWKVSGDGLITLQSISNTVRQLTNGVEVTNTVEINDTRITAALTNNTHVLSNQLERVYGAVTNQRDDILRGQISNVVDFLNRQTNVNNDTGQLSGLLNTAIGLGQSAAGDGSNQVTTFANAIHVPEGTAPASSPVGLQFTFHFLGHDQVFDLDPTHNTTIYSACQWIRNTVIYVAVLLYMAYIWWLAESYLKNINLQTPLPSRLATAWGGVFKNVPFVSSLSGVAWKILIGTAFTTLLLTIPALAIAKASSVNGLNAFTVLGTDPLSAGVTAGGAVALGLWLVNLVIPLGFLIQLFVLAFIDHLFMWVVWWIISTIVRYSPD